MVGQHDDLPLPGELGEDAERGRGSLIVEGHQDVVEDDGQRWIAAVLALTLQLADRCEAKRQVDLVRGAFGELVRGQLLLVGADDPQAAAAGDAGGAQGDVASVGEPFEEAPGVGQQRGGVLTLVRVQLVTQDLILDL